MRGSRRSPWRSARYRFTRYRKSEGHRVKLELSQSLDRDEL